MDQTITSGNSSYECDSLGFLLNAGLHKVFIVPPFFPFFPIIPCHLSLPPVNLCDNLCQPIIFVLTVPGFFVSFDHFSFTVGVMCQRFFHLVSRQVLCVSLLLRLQGSLLSCDQSHNFFQVPFGANVLGPAPICLPKKPIPFRLPPPFDTLLPDSFTRAPPLAFLVLIKAILHPTGRLVTPGRNVHTTEVA